MFFSFAFCTFFKIFHVRLGKKSKSVSFSRVYLCVKAKLTLVSFFTFFSMHLSLEVIPDTYQEHALKCFRTTKVLARRLSASSDLEIQFSRNEKKPPLDRGALKMCTFKVLHKLGTSCLAQHHSSLKVGVCDNH